MTCKSIITTSHSFLNAANFFAKETEANPARIHSPDPFLRAGKFSRGFAKSFLSENSFGKTESALKPHALPEYLEGRTPKEKHPFLFQKKFHPRQIKNARSVFLSGLLAYSPVRGAFSERTLQFRFTTHAERATSFVLEVGASLVQ